MKRTFLFFAGMVAAGCAGAQTDDATGGAGGTGPATTATTTAMSSSSTGGGCEQDCSTIPVPACYESICNGSSHQCDVKQAANGSDCDDDLFCTLDTKCHNGVCDGGTPNLCEGMGDECNTYSCDMATDACKPMQLPNQTMCTPSNLCAALAVCIGGDCLDAPKDCTGASDECNQATGTCDVATGNCITNPINEGNACTGGAFCEINKVCTAGVCMGSSTGVTEVMASGAGLPMAIPDSPAAGITNTVNIAQTGNIVRVAATINITHTDTLDLFLTLTPPAGAAITLIDGVGNGSEDNFTGTTLASDATIPIATGTQPFTGTFLPTGSFAPVVGTAVNGNWILGVTDQAGADVGTLDSWTFHACVQ